MIWRLIVTTLALVLVSSAADARPRHHRHLVYSAAQGSVVGSRPAGCPSRYCGCGASLEVYGRIVPGLNLAAAWLRFPRTSPAPGTVAARRGHVFVLKQHVEGDVWMVKDYNSGGGLTRYHARSIRGYTIVQPT